MNVIWPVALLVQKGAWHHLLLLTRWNLADNVIPDAAHYELQDKTGQHVQQTHEPLHPEDLDQLLEHVREKASVATGGDIIRVLEHQAAALTSFARSLREEGRDAMLPTSALTYSTAGLVRTLLLSRHLCDSTSLPNVIQQAVSMVLPTMEDSVSQMFTESQSRFPSSSTISRARVVLDASMCLIENSPASSQSQHLRFGLADASPQKGVNWLLSAYDSVSLDKVIKTFRAVSDLILKGKGQADQDPDVSGLEDVIFQNVRRQFCLPQGLGSGAATLPRKVSWKALCQPSPPLQGCLVKQEAKSTHPPATMSSSTLEKRF